MPTIFKSPWFWGIFTLVIGIILGVVGYSVYVRWIISSATI